MAANPQTNEAKGEIVVEIAGKQVPLALTLGAIAFMETAWACETLEDVFRRLSTLRGAADLLIVIEALANGHLTRREVAILTPNEFAILHAAIQKALNEAFPGEDPKKASAANGSTASRSAAA